jgi:hypothetical protein
VGGCGLDLSVSGQRPVACSFEHGHEHSVSMRIEKILDQLSDYRFIEGLLFVEIVNAINVMIVMFQEIAVALPLKGSAMQTLSILKSCFWTQMNLKQILRKLIAADFPPFTVRFTFILCLSVEKCSSFFLRPKEVTYWHNFVIRRRKRNNYIYFAIGYKVDVEPG